MNKAFEKNFLIETAWEVCNQVGGIYTVLRSKILAQQQEWGKDYLLVGPFLGKTNEFEQIDEDDGTPAYRVVENMRNQGVEIYYGTWLVSGRPKTVLINPYSIFYKLAEIKYEIWEAFDIPSETHDDLKDQVIGFGFLLQWFLHDLIHENKKKKHVIHFHEWMVGLPVPYLRRSGVNAKLVFTTHATLLGRYLAMHDPRFYERLPYVSWEHEAIHFNSLTQIKLERAAAHGAHILTTVSDITAQECIYLLGRAPEVITPNGLNINRYEAIHEFQSLHVEAKKKINEFVIGHFFPSYKFDLENTIYFFTSGRFEYKNKGYDLTLEALARLNHLMHKEGINKTVVMFIVTKQPSHGINVQSLNSRAMMEELRSTCKQIENEVSKKLFYSVAGDENDKLPDLNKFVEDYMKLSFRRAMQSSQTINLPPVSTHNLMNDKKDDILNFVRVSGMYNKPEDKVKIVYHPEFISATSPLFHMEYDEFIRGCHMGVFPSYYEPWGYTPVECLVRGIPAITSDLAGFGDYVKKHLPREIGDGLYVVDRLGKTFDQAADQLAYTMLEFINMNRRERISQRNVVEEVAQNFDWDELIQFYTKTYKKAIKAL